MTKKKRFIILGIGVAIVASVVVATLLVLKNEQKPVANTAPNSDQQSQQEEPEQNQTEEKPAVTQPEIPISAPLSTFDKTRYKLDDPNDLGVVINKKRPLPSTYAPADLTNSGGGLLRSEAAAALASLRQAASSAGVPMSVLSAYRSYNTQNSTYNGWVARDGQAQADTYSARPGHSEHQTGLAVDLGNSTCDLEICFGSTAAGQWLAANAHTYGFIIRYPEGKQSITGYQYEPWHLRYVGKELASEIQKSGQTMEEFFGLPAAPSY